MLFKSSKGKEKLFYSDFALESKVVTKAIRSYTKPVRLTWNRENYVLGHPEARFALALNGGTIYLNGSQARIVVPCTWPRHSDYRDHSFTTPLVAWPEIRVQEGLFWVLEEAGWIHAYDAVWAFDVPGAGRGSA